MTKAAAKQVVDGVEQLLANYASDNHGLQPGDTFECPRFVFITVPHAGEYALALVVEGDEDAIAGKLPLLRLGSFKDITALSWGCNLLLKRRHGRKDRDLNEIMTSAGFHSPQKIALSPPAGARVH